MRKEDSGFRIQGSATSPSPFKGEEVWLSPFSYHHQPSTINHQPTRGFTLLEMSVVITIIALFVGSFLSVVARNSEDKRIRITQTKLDYIMRKIEDYAVCNTDTLYLPCPASPTAAFTASGAAGFGLGAGSGAANCTASTDVSSVSIGAVPIRELGIAPSYMFDGWNRRFTYVVDESMTSAAGYTTGTQNIVIYDVNGASILGTGNNAAVLVVSHGQNGFGAWTYSGAADQAAIGGTTPTDGSPDYENQDFATAVFVVAAPNKAAAGTYSDDILAYRTKWQFRASTEICP